MHLTMQALEQELQLDFYSKCFEYFQAWKLPKVRSEKLSNMFSSKRKTANKEAGTFKATASEGLSLCSIFLHAGTGDPATQCLCARAECLHLLGQCGGHIASFVSQALHFRPALSSSGCFPQSLQKSCLGRVVPPEISLDSSYGQAPIQMVYVAEHLGT